MYCGTVLLSLLIYVVVSRTSAQSGIPEGAATLAFVFDTTGSMYDDLVQIRAGASKILSQSLKQQVKPLYNYAIVPFHDPDVGPATITTDTKVFQRQLDDLYVQGGGDCPEMSLSAIMLALEISLPGSFIYVFTDAQAKDVYLKDKVLQLVQLKQSQVHFVLTGDCHNETADPGFSTYKLISAASTGQVFHLMKKDVNQVLRFAEEFVRANKVNILSVDIHDGGSRTFAIPIDKALDKVTFSLSGKGAKLVIKDPSGQTLTTETGLQNLLLLKSAVSFAIRKPISGFWNVSVSSDEGFALRITGMSAVHFVYGFSLSATVDMRNLVQRPAGGFSNFAVIRVLGLVEPGSVIKAQLVDLQGNAFKEIAFNPRPDDQFTFDWVNFQPPSGLFYIRLIGTDEKGNVFHRCSQTAISANLPEMPKTKADPVREVLLGNSITLSCRVESIVPAKSYWQKGLRTVSPTMTRNGIFNITHTISSVRKIDQGLYTCYSSNIGGVDKATTRLNVKVPRPVVIEKDEVQLTVKSGDTIVLRCAAKTKFRVTFTWYRNGQQIQGLTHARHTSNGSLFLDIRGRQDSGRYRCIAKSEVGQIARTTILNVNEAPFVFIDTATKNFQLGEEIQCACLVRGFPEPTVTWKKHGKRLTSNDMLKITKDHLLIIKNAKPLDAGRYECVASNVVGQSKAVVNLRYTVPPTVYIDKDEFTVKEGDSVTLECRAHAQPTPKIQWYKGRFAIVPSRRIATSSRGHLVINAVQRSDTGFYTCVALNVAGSDSVRVSFNAQVPPQVTIDKEQVFISPHGSTKVQCQANGTPPPVVNWYKNKIALGPVGRVYASKTGQLSIKKAVSSDAGNYTCTAMSIGGSTSVVVEIIVGVPPRILAPPVDQAVKLGENVTFYCVSEGVPQPNITWDKSLGSSIHMDPRYVVPYRGALHIRNVQVKDAGKYVCVAENDYGRVEESTVLMLIGLSPPTISKDVQDTIRAISGQDHEIACPAQGIPTPVITWSFEGSPVDTKGSKVKVKAAGSLVIKKISKMDSGLYTCTAVNTAGSDSHTYTLIIQVPPSITTPPRDVIVDSDGIILLECQANGLPIPKFSWQLSNVTLPFNQSRLTIRKASVYNSGTYRCIASNEAGIDTVDFVVNVRGAPKIVHEDKVTFSGRPGQSVILPCRVLGYPKPLISWLRNNTLLALNKDKFRQNPAGSLRVTGLEPNDIGSYTCHAINQEGFDTVNVTLLVEERPTFVKVPQNKTVVEGKNLTLECVTRGFPPPQIVWSHNGRVLPFSQPVLEIKHAIKNKHEGSYMCTASNLAGSIKLGSIIRILSRSPPTEVPTDDTSAQGSLPVFTASPFDVTLDAGSSLLWNCAATGRPPPEIQWNRNGVILFSSSNERLSIFPNNSLYITDLKLQDQDIYQCRAFSEFITTAVTATLTVRARSLWSKWSEWSACSVTCGTGRKVRTRSCTSPSSSRVNSNCSGSSVQMQSCAKRSCLVDNGPIATSGITGQINDVMLPKITFKANFTRRKSNITELNCKVDGLPSPIRNWFKYAVPVTAPIYWAGSSGQPGAKNGLEKSHGFFNFSTRITYPNGEVLLIDHTGQGVNDNGEMVMDVKIKGATPKFPPKTHISFRDFKDLFVITGNGQITSTGERYFTVDDKTFQYLCNNTVTYKPSTQAPSSLSQTLEVMDVDINERPGGIDYAMKTFVKRSPFPDECPQGMVRDAKGEYCEDMNECLFRDTCEHICENSFGGFKCLCRKGFALQNDTRSCRDIDECSLPTTTCPPDHNCVNTEGSYACRRDCGDGYTRSADGNCEDVDECLSFSGKPETEDPCTQTCTNTIGSFKCSCRKGYQMRNGRCQDIDECVGEICFHGCENTIGGFNCFCFEGYKKKSSTMCEDIDECKDNSTLCGPLQCSNTDGSYSCLASCRTGYKRTLQGNCEDHNECTDGSHNCQFNQLCINTIGSFYCLCPRGFKSMRNDGPCEDLNECQQFPGICQYKCVNTRGSYKCVCPPGGQLEADGRSCSGVDGCVLQNLQCDQGCILTRFGYRCACYKGYRLHEDKKTCADVNECLSNKTNTCQYKCVNTVGSYKCRCPIGYSFSADGKRCNDIDECTLNPGVCRNPNERCMNTHGSYRCVKTDCPDNYNILGPGYCLQRCTTGRLCVPQALRYYTVKLSIGVAANQDLLHLLPYYPSYLHSGLLICEFKYYFPDKSTPFGIKQIGNQAVIFTIRPILKSGTHQLNVKAHIKNPDGSLACVTDFVVYIDVAKYLF